MAPVPPPAGEPGSQAETDQKESNPRRPSSETDGDLVGQALGAFESGDAALARKLIDRVDLSLAQPTSFWLLAGVLKEKAGDSSAAMDIYSKGIDSSPSPNLYYRRALLFRANGNLEAALGDLEEVVGEEPNDLLASNERFLLLLQMGRKEQMLAELRDKNSGGKSLREGSCVLGLCGLALENGQFSEAVTLLNHGKSLLEPTVFEQLLSNPVILRHQAHPALLPFYIRNIPGENPSPP